MSHPTQPRPQLGRGFFFSADDTPAVAIARGRPLSATDAGLGRVGLRSSFRPFATARGVNSRCTEESRLARSKSIARASWWCPRIVAKGKIKRPSTRQ